MLIERHGGEKSIANVAVFFIKSCSPRSFVNHFHIEFRTEKLENRVDGLGKKNFLVQLN